MNIHLGFCWIVLFVLRLDSHIPVFLPEAREHFEMRHFAHSVLTILLSRDSFLQSRLYIRYNKGRWKRKLFFFILSELEQMLKFAPNDLVTCIFLQLSHRLQRCPLKNCVAPHLLHRNRNCPTFYLIQWLKSPTEDLRVQAREPFNNMPSSWRAIFHAGVSRDLIYRIYCLPPKREETLS